MTVENVQVQPKQMDEIDIIEEDSEKRAEWLRLGKWISVDIYNLEKYIIVGYAHGWLKQYELLDLLRREIPSSWVSYTALLESKSKAGDTINFEDNTYKYSILNPEIETIKEIIAAFNNQSSEEVKLDNDAELKELLSTFSYSEFEIFLNKYISNPKTTGLRKRRQLQANNQSQSQLPESKPEPAKPIAAILVQKGVIDGKRNKTVKEIHIAEREQEENKDYVTKRINELGKVREKRRKDELDKKRPEKFTEQPLQEPKKVDTKPEAHQTQIVPSDSGDKPKAVTVPGRLLQSTDGINVNDISRWLAWFRNWAIIGIGNTNDAPFHIPTEQEVQHPDAKRWKVITPEEVRLFKTNEITNKAGTIWYLYGIADGQLYISVTQLLSKDIMVYDATK